MAPSTRRRKATPTIDDDAIPESIFDALNAHNPGDTEVSEKGPKKSDNEPSVADLVKQLSDMGSRLDAAERANIALTTAPPKMQETPQEPVFNLDGLPDPLDDKDGYAKALATRTAQYSKDVQEYQNKVTAQAQEKSGNSDALWQDFNADYSDYAADPEGIEFATNQVVKQAKRKGLDLNRYMYQNTERFFTDITKAYDKRFGKPDGEDSPDRDETPSRKRKVTAREDDAEPDDATRTGGIFGGIDGSGSGRKAAGPPLGDMIKDLQDMQRKGGYY